MQALFYMDIQETTDPEALERFCRSFQPSQKAFALFSELVNGVLQNRRGIDRVIERFSSNWKMSRMSCVDRNVLRIAVYELLNRPDIPAKVSINEAIDNYRNYDIILTDYEMSRMDGLELASRIRVHSDLPIIIYSNHGCEKIAERAFTMGVNAYVKKEIEPEHYLVLAKRIKAEVDRYRSNRMLREYNERLRNIFEVSPHAIAVIDLEGRIIDCNKSTLEMFGVETLEEVQGLNCMEFVAPGDILKAKRDLVNCIERGFLDRVEYELVSDYGRRFPAKLSASVMDGLDGRPGGIVIFIEDISKVRDMEASIYRYNHLFNGYLKAGNDPLTKA